MDNIIVGTDKVIYPVLEEVREKRVPVCQERMLYGETGHYFSPTFKTSNEVINGILRGYDSKKGLTGLLSGPDLVVKADFKKKRLDEDIKGVLIEINKGRDTEISKGDVVAYYKDSKYTFLLTTDRILSDYKRDDEDKYVDSRLTEVYISSDETSIYDLEKNTKIVSRCTFEKKFIGLFNELQELNKDVQPIHGKHPLSEEMGKVKESYFNILVDKSLDDGNLSANEVVRMEILARQMGIASLKVLEMISKAISNYEMSKNDESTYIYSSLRKMDRIDSKYYYMLYHDVLTFELLSNKGEVVEKLGQFSQTLAKKCSINENFKEKYAKSMQKLVVSSYSLRNTIDHEGKTVVEENKDAFSNLYKSMEYEYNLQKELLK